MSEGSRSVLAPSLQGAVLGRYRLERLLGEGGMGVVYAARHQDLGKTAAVKILHERHDGRDQVRVRFFREGQAASRIRHPNIVDVYDVGSEAGRVYLVMELLEGENLGTLLAREKRLSQRRTADLLVPVVAAVATAHDLGVVHRDLKPDNVFLSTGRNTVSPKVLDFGISKVSDPERDASLTGTGALLGTPYYMSPEQAQTAKSIDGRSDQYSLAVIAYECVTGRRPVEEPALFQLMQRIVSGDFPTPRQIEPTLSAGFEQLILKGMAREPGDRFPTTRAFGRALLAFASERVRANYAEELEEQERVVPPAPLSPARADGVSSTTLSESVHERENKHEASRPNRMTGFIASGAVLLGVTALGAWSLLRAPSEAHEIRPNSSVEAPRAAESPPVAPVPAVAAAPAPSAPVSAAASAVASTPPAKTKRPQRPPNRPELAPR